MYGEGVSKEGGLLDVGVAMDGHQDRRLVHLRRDPAGPGSRGVQGVPQGQSGHRREIDGQIRAKINDVRSRSRASRRPSAEAAWWRGRRRGQSRRCAVATIPAVVLGRGACSEATRSVAEGAAASRRPAIGPTSWTASSAARARHARRRGVRPGVGRVREPGPQRPRGAPRLRRARLTCGVDRHGIAWSCGSARGGRARGLTTAGLASAAPALERVADPGDASGLRPVGRSGSIAGPVGWRRRMRPRRG